MYISNTFYGQNNNFKFHNKSLFDIYKSNDKKSFSTNYVQKLKEPVEESNPIPENNVAQESETRIEIKNNEISNPDIDPVPTENTIITMKDPISEKEELKNIHLPTKENQRTNKYKLEKVIDPITGMMKYILKNLSVESTTTKFEDLPDPFENNVEPSTRTYDLEKNANGIYALKELDYKDENSETMESSIFDIYTIKNQDKFHNFELSKNMNISKFSYKENYNILLGQNSEFVSDLSVRDIIHNSDYLHNSSYIKNIIIKIINNLNHSVIVRFKVYYLKNDQLVIKKICDVNIGTIHLNCGKIVNQNIDFLTHKNGCFLFYTMNIISEKGGLSGDMEITYKLYLSNKNKNKDKVVNIANINDRIQISQ